jgi:hypothetical protein
MGFTYDPTTDRGRVRLLINDTDEETQDRQLFEDAEIDAFLLMEGNDVWSAAAAACRSIAASSARSAIRYQASQIVSVDRTKVPDHFRALADKYEKRATAAASLAEYVDSQDHVISPFGEDMSEYVGDELL